MKSPMFRIHLVWCQQFRPLGSSRWCGPQVMPRGQGSMRMVDKYLYQVGPPNDSVQLVPITPIIMVYMTLLTILCYCDLQANFLQRGAQCQ